MAGDPAPFDAVAERYDRLYGDRHCRAEDWLISQWLEDELRGRTVLDAGCGTGWLIDHVKTMRAYRGFDISEGLLEQARRKTAEAPRGSTRRDVPNAFTRHDMTERPWPGSVPYTAVTSLWCSASYVSEMDFALSAWQALRSGGKVVAMPHAPAAAREGRIWSDLVYLPAACYNGSTGWRPWRAEVALDAFRSAGFRDVEVSGFRTPFELPAWMPVAAHVLTRIVESKDPSRTQFLIVTGRKP